MTVIVIVTWHSCKVSCSGSEGVSMDTRQKSAACQTAALLAEGAAGFSAAGCVGGAVVQQRHCTGAEELGQALCQASSCVRPPSLCRQAEQASLPEAMWLKHVCFAGAPFIINKSQRASNVDLYQHLSAGQQIPGSILHGH